MKIAIIGSYKPPSTEFSFQGTAEKFQEACRELGKGLASLGHSLIVGSTSRRSADYHIVRGIFEDVDAATIRRPVVEVLRPSDETLPYEEMATQKPQLFTFRSRTESRWRGVHLVAIKEADAVLTVGGKTSTYYAGMAALIAEKKVVPIGSFGGASSKILESMERLRPEADLLKIRQLNGPWTRQSSQIATGILASTSLLLIHGRSQDWVVLKDWLSGHDGVSSVVVMQQQFGAGRTLPEKFEDLAGAVDAAIAIATPDDLGALRDAADPTFSSRARQNVWLEVGWFWGRLGRHRMMVFCRQDLDIPTDLQGLELYYYNSAPTERAEELRAFLRYLQYGA